MGFPQESTRKPFGLVTNLPLQQADIKEISKNRFRSLGLLSKTKISL
jgi:hypothetical protein